MLALDSSTIARPPLRWTPSCSPNRPSLRPSSSFPPRYPGRPPPVALSPPPLPSPPSPCPPPIHSASTPASPRPPPTPALSPARRPPPSPPPTHTHMHTHRTSGPTGHPGAHRRHLLSCLRNGTLKIIHFFFCKLTWFRSSAGGGFAEIKGVDGPYYQPSADDIGTHICIKCTLVDSAALFGASSGGGGGGGRSPKRGGRGRHGRNARGGDRVLSPSRSQAGEVSFAEVRTGDVVGVGGFWLIVGWVRFGLVSFSVFSCTMKELSPSWFRATGCFSFPPVG